MSAESYRQFWEELDDIAATRLHRFHYEGFYSCPTCGLSTQNIRQFVAHWEAAACAGRNLPTVEANPEDPQVDV